MSNPGAIVEGLFWLTVVGIILTLATGVWGSMKGQSHGSLNQPLDLG